MKLNKFFLAGLFTLLFAVSAFCQTYYAAGIYSVSVKSNECHLTAANEDFVMTKLSVDSTKLADGIMHPVFILAGVSTDSLYLCGVGMWPSDNMYTIAIMELKTNQISSANGTKGTIGYNVGKALFQAWDDLHKEVK